MRNRLRQRWRWLASVYVTAAIGLGAEQGRPAFVGNADIVSVYPVVRSQDGTLVTDLTREEFQILDNGQPAEIVVFENTPQALTVAMLLDASDVAVYVEGKNMRAVEPALRRLADVCRAFFDHLLPGDRIRLGTIGGEIALSPHLTGDRGLLNRILDEELWWGGMRPLWSGTHAAMDSLQHESGRRVVLLLMFGPDDCAGFAGRCEKSKSVEQRVSDEGFLVYAIDLRVARMDAILHVDTGAQRISRMDPGGPGSDVTRLARQSGGGTLVIDRFQDLAVALQHVADELRHQYGIGFRPARLDGKTHTIDVRALRPGLQVQARRTYLARTAR